MASTSGSVTTEGRKAFLAQVANADEELTNAIMEALGNNKFASAAQLIAIEWQDFVDEHRQEFEDDQEGEDDPEAWSDEDLPCDLEEFCAAYAEPVEDII